MNNDRFKFRVPIKCNVCKFQGFQYWEWNGRQFIEAGHDKCKCKAPAFEIVGSPEQCTGLSAAKSYRGNKPENLLVWEEDKGIILTTAGYMYAEVKFVDGCVS